MQLGYLATYMLYVGRLVALAAMWHGRKIGAVGFENEPLQGHLFHYLIESRVFECHNASYAKHKVAHLCKVLVCIDAVGIGVKDTT